MRNYLGRCSTLWVLSAGLSVAQAQPPDKIPNALTNTPDAQAGLPLLPAGIKVDLSTPDSTLRTFTQALDHGDLKAASKCVVNANFAPVFTEWEQQMQQHRMELPFQGMALAATAKIEVQGDTAVATQQLTFRREGLDWKIVPGDAVALQDSKAPTLLFFATMIAHPEVFVRLRGQARDTACASNLKQLALGTLMLAQDMDEKFALTAMQHWQAQHDHRGLAWIPFQQALMPYVKSEPIFHCPEDKTGEVSYAFNMALDNISLAKITTPSETVLLYEGKDRQLDFRHEGRAGVAFADGHVKLVNAEQAKGLRWHP